MPVSMEPQIVAIGGGGFSDGSENLGFERFLLCLAHKQRPKVCFVPTASGDSEQYLLRFYASFARLSVTATHLPLFRLAIRDLRSHLLGQDIVFVGGGNTRNMLVLCGIFAPLLFSANLMPVHCDKLFMAFANLRPLTTRRFELLSILPGNDSIHPSTVRRSDGRQAGSFWSRKICCRIRTTLGTRHETGKKLYN